MTSYLFQRLAGTLPVLLLISFLVFSLIHAAPGDPTLLLLGEETNAAEIARAKERWGLDQPLYVQYLKFLRAAAAGDFGKSFKYAEPVINVIKTRLPATIELAVFAIIIASLLAIPLGVWAGAKPNSWIDNLGTTFGLFGISMPSFWLAIMLIPVPGFGAGFLEPKGNLGWFIDSTLLSGHTWVWAPAPGFDPEGIGRALVQNLRGERIQGGSSITQQLIKNILISEAERTQLSYTRKVKEVILATEITRRYTKDEILELYLRDNQQAWMMQADGKYKRKTPRLIEPLVDVQSVLMRSRNAACSTSQMFSSWMNPPPRLIRLLHDT